MAGHWVIMLGSQQETSQDTKAFGPDTPKDNRICDVRTERYGGPDGEGGLRLHESRVFG